jgi:uncharacterized protein (TIGR02996 family)
MSMLQHFLNEVSAAPGDWPLRGVAADWCEDHGEPSHAECLRWTRDRRKRPYHFPSDRATWFNAAGVDAALGDPESDLPPELFAKLEGGAAVANQRGYADGPEAELALLAAWARARAEGWVPA